MRIVNFETRLPPSFSLKQVIQANKRGRGNMSLYVRERIDGRVLVKFTLLVELTIIRWMKLE